MKFEFNYQVTGKTLENESFESEGYMKVQQPMFTDEDDFYMEDEYDDSVDDGMLFGEAFKSAINHVYLFEIEKQNKRGISEVNMTIKNLKVIFKDEDNSQNENSKSVNKSKTKNKKLKPKKTKGFGK